MMTTKLYRNRRKNIVHAANCRKMGPINENMIPWMWAEDKTRAELEDADVQWCKICKPLDVIEAA